MLRATGPKELHTEHDIGRSGKLPSLPCACAGDSWAPFPGESYFTTIKNIKFQLRIQEKMGNVFSPDFRPAPLAGCILILYMDLTLKLNQETKGWCQKE